MIDNPFITKGYVGPEYFCDREKETETLLKNVLSGCDTVLISPRRYGKSGLIHHLMNRLKRDHPEFSTLLVDISTTTSLGSFLDTLSSAILDSFPEKTPLGKRFMNFLKRVRPYFGFNELTGKTEVHLELVSVQEKEKTLSEVLGILESAPNPVLLAIDEFQRITEYPEANMEALLRSCIQNMHNVRFVFSGSKRRMMVSIFNDATRPFYASTASLHLQKLDKAVYGSFIANLFDQYGRTIRPDALQYVLDWTRCHTYYTQRLCQKLFYAGSRDITLDCVLHECGELLEAEEYTYLLFEEILPVQQWRLLRGIAREQGVEQITASAFISRYRIGSAATALRAAESLEQKEMLLKTITREGSRYEVYDVFFSRWLEKEF